MSDDLKTNYTKLNKRYQEIKRQLEEKEETIEKINKEFVQAVKDWKSLVERKNQEKISFSVEQLEKVKEILIQNADIDFRKNCYINAVELDKFIDNQINELKRFLEI